ncbi:MAG TPA: hypothetical protein VLN25_02655 [Burkholderiaceae bacterium]|nr:hypothetical protein [Burkholderiaceae bacterium]
MNLEPGIVKTVNLDNEQLLMIESPRGDCVCVIHRGIYLIGCSQAQGHDRSGGSSVRTWRTWLAWIRGRLLRHPTPAATAHRNGLRPEQWVPA